MKRRSWSTRGALLLLAAAFLWGTAAQAMEAPPCVAVWADGYEHEAVRRDIARALGDAYVAKSPRELLGALPREARGAASLAGLARNPRRHAAALVPLRDAARSVGLDVVILVHVERRRGGRFARAVVVDMTRPEPGVVDVEGTDEALGAAVVAELAKRRTDQEPTPQTEAETTAEVLPPVHGAPAPDQAPLRVTPPTEARDLRDSADEARRVRARDYGHAVLDVDVGMEVGMRSFSYRDGLTKNLRDYRLAAAPLGAASAAVYPLGPSRTPWLADLGAVGGYARAFALDSAPSGGTALGTTWSHFYVGGRLRLRTGDDTTSPVLGASGTYGGESFTFDAGTAGAPLPAASYRFVKPGIDARVPLGRAALTASAGYLFVLSAGDTAGRFPHAAVGGVEASLGATCRLVSGFELRLTASYRRFFYAMHPAPADAFVAGGALDQFADLEGSLAYVY